MPLSDAPQRAHLYMRTLGGIDSDRPRPHQGERPNYVRDGR